MVKDARDVIDPFPAFDYSQKNVVVLRAIKLRAESTNFVHQLAPNDGEVAKIIAGEKIIRRPIRFEDGRSEEHTSELQSLRHLVCRLLLEKKKNINKETKTA